MNISVFAACACTLGEGIYFDELRRYIYWVDIVESNIYRKSVDGFDGKYETFSAGNLPSAILTVSDDVVTYLDKTGICILNVKMQNISSLSKTPYVEQEGYRGNDATVLDDGSILYGTMYQYPQKKESALYRLVSGNVNELKGISFGIPNTFIELDNEILVSDSLEKRVYSISKNFDVKIEKNLWKDFSTSDCTPDGGCADKHGNIYISMWDGFCVCVLDRDGNEKYRVDLPVPRPTNCTLVDERWLYVTTAREGLTDELLRKYPLSGSVFVIDMGKWNEN